MTIKRILLEVSVRVSYLVLAVFCALFRFYYPSTLSYVFMVVSVLYVISFEIYVYISSRNMKKTLKKIASVSDSENIGRLYSFPMPLVACQSNGDIVWMNEKFVEILGDQYCSKLYSVKEFGSNILDSSPVTVSIADKVFSVYSYRTSEKAPVTLIFDDNTDYSILKKEQQLLKPVVAYLMIDNFDELFKNIRESDTSVSVAKIDETIIDWASKTSGIIKKIDKNRYLFIFESRFMPLFIQNRFDILDTVRELPIMSVIPPTLSIGIGLDRLSFGENEDMAKKSLDMALSRGGDQVVISRNAGFEFFGGYARISDNRAKIRSRVLAASFSELLDSVDKVVAMGHQTGDMDSLGACVGIIKIAKSRGKKAFIVTDPATNLADSLYERLTMSKDFDGVFLSKEDALLTVDLNTLVVVVDTHRPGYTEMPELIKFAGKLAVIDHHRKAADYISDTDFFYHEPYASSTCEMITEIVEYLGDVSLSVLEADALLAGIYLDTKNFSVKTGTCTFEAAAYLKQMGASIMNVKLMFQTNVSTYKLKAEIIRKTEMYRTCYAIAVCDFVSDGNLKLASSQAADEMLNIEGAQATFTVYPLGNGCGISSRSFGNVNVQLIMEKLGGGGHQSMAGTQIKDCNIKEAYIKLTNAIDSYIEGQAKQ